MKCFTISEAFSENEKIKICEDVHGVEAEHFHEFIEFVYIIKGNMIHSINGEFLDLKSGGLIYIMPGSSHSYVSGEEVKFVNIFVRPDFLGKGTDVFEFCTDLIRERNSAVLKPYIQFGHDESLQIDHIISLMLKEYRAKNFGYQTILENCLKTSILIMLRKIKDQQLEPIPMMDMRAYVDLHCFDNFSLKEIAATFGYSSSYFSRKFKNQYGISLNSYIHRSRVQAAVLLLKNTNFTVEETARTVGYRDTKQIFKMFKKYLNRTPRSVRKEG